MLFIKLGCWDTYLQLVGGVDHVQQSIALGKRPNIVVSCVTAD